MPGITVLGVIHGKTKPRARPQKQFRFYGLDLWIENPMGFGRSSSKPWIPGVSSNGVCVCAHKKRSVNSFFSGFSTDFRKFAS